MEEVNIKEDIWSYKRICKELIDGDVDSSICNVVHFVNFVLRLTKTP